MWLIFIRVNSRLLVILVGESSEQVSRDHANDCLKYTLIEHVVRGLLFIEEIDHFNEAVFLILLEVSILLGF